MIGKKHELFLKACLFQGEEARQVWETWKTMVTLEEADTASLELSPLLYQNLSQNRIDDDTIDKLKGYFRHTWYNNQMLFRAAEQIVGCFEKAGIRVMFLKGPALILNYYKNYGVRQMKDFDLLVPYDKKEKAIELMEQSDWKLLPIDLRDREKENYFQMHHACTFEDDRKRKVDLHWRIFNEYIREKEDETFWEKAVTVSFGNHSVFTMSPEDQLLHVIGHGMGWNYIANIRWVTDAKIIIENADIDWARFMEQVDRYRFRLQAKRALVYLKEVFRIPIPDELVKTLKNLPVSRIQKIEYRLKNSPYLCTVRVHLCNFLRSSYPKTVWGFLRFMKEFWDAGTVWEVPFIAVGRGFRRLYRILVKHPV